MKLVLSSALILFVFSVSSFAAVSPAWVASYDGPSNGDETFYDMAQGLDGSVYITGESDGPDGKSDMTVVKYDSAGREIWVRRFVEANDKRDYTTSLKTDSDGNVLVAGQSVTVSMNSEDLTVVKYSPEGERQWAATYDGPENGPDHYPYLTLSPTGDIYLFGTIFDHSIINVDVYYKSALVKYDGDGTLQWDAVRDEITIDYRMAKGLGVDAEGNAYVAVDLSYQDPFGYGYLIAKYSPQGREIWSAYSSDAGGRGESLNNLAVNSDGEIYVVGKSVNGDGDTFSTITKYDTDGLRLWSDDFSPGADFYVYGWSIALNNDGEPVIAANYYSPNSDIHGVAVIQYDESGTRQWIYSKERFLNKGIGIHRRPQ